jgi:hypothetical protein
MGSPVSPPRSHLADPRVVELHRVQELKLNLPYCAAAESQIFSGWLSKIFLILKFPVVVACRDADAHRAEMEKLLSAIILVCTNMRRVEIGSR